MNNIEAISLFMAGMNRAKNSDLKKAAIWMAQLTLHGLPVEWQRNERQALVEFFDFVTSNDVAFLNNTEMQLAKSFVK